MVLPHAVVFVSKMLAKNAYALDVRGQVLDILAWVSYT
jgi:hypothetical protein